MFSKRSAQRNAAYLLPYLKPTMHLLDCGCGPGSITIDFAKIINRGFITGVDIEESQLLQANELAKQNNISNISFQKGDIRKLPFADNTFDVAHVNGVLCQNKEPLTSIYELKRVVKPGGIIAAREPDFETYLVYPDNEYILEAMSLAKNALDCLGGNFYIGRRLKKLFTQAEFSRINAGASCDTYGGSGISIQEACDAMSNDWTEAPWGKYVLEKKWASQNKINKFKEAFDNLAKDNGAFINVTWYEIIAFNDK